MEENPPVSNNKPTVQSNSPIVLSMTSRYFFKTLSKPSNLLIKIAKIKKGTPRPIAQKLNRTVPFKTDPLEAAKLKIAPNCGPIQGVQPKAKASPRT